MRTKRIRLVVAAAAWLAAPLSSVAQARVCAIFEPLRQPFFGDLHVHSERSFDAWLFETRNDPRDAYSFAKGAPLGIPPLDAQGEPTRTLQLRRPLDFAAVTDHAELLGETSICLTPSHPLYDTQACQIYRSDSPTAFSLFASMLGSLAPERLAFCGTNGFACLAAARDVWSEIVAAAEEHQDAAPGCAFSTFAGYEWTGSPGGDTLHRNVFFRSANVPGVPLSYVEASSPEALWSGLLAQCASVGGECEAIAIPHNSNQSGGLAFDPAGLDGTPMNTAEALLRAELEPLVELVQHKGESECRFQVDGAEEECNFEKTAAVPPAQDTPLSYVRSALRTGLALGEQLGVNPYVLGFVGATDTHLGTPGAVREDEYPGHGGDAEGTPEQRLGGGSLRNSPGGLTVLWAPENTRAALFDAMRRRESYATSGTRPLVRFFGGFGLALDLCDAPDFVAQADAAGVPMGGALGPSAGAPPRFAVSALMDPGAPGLPGTPLERIQIVKGWLDANGDTHETVVDVAGSSANGASLDTTTCQVGGSDFASLCTVWEDPDFDPAEPAFYYARVLENESCRWSTWECNAAGVDCTIGAPAGFEACCDATVPKSIQERAWTSPIWYRTREPLVAPALPAAGAGAFPLAGGLLAAALLAAGARTLARRQR